MYAVIKTGGKQYKVAKNDVVVVERLTADAGSSVTLDQVLMVGGEGKTEVGAPFVDGASVTAEVIDQARGPKVLVFKKKRRKNHRRKNGHRQDLTVLRVTDILTGGAKPKKAAAPKVEAKMAEPKLEAEAAPAEEKAEAPKTEAKKAAPKKAAAPKAAAKKPAAKKPAAKKPAAKKAADKTEE
jgi:large subunit ribosomal protein L21